MESSVPSLPPSRRFSRDGYTDICKDDDLFVKFFVNVGEESFFIAIEQFCLFYVTYEHVRIQIYMLI